MDLKKLEARVENVTGCTSHPVLDTSCMDGGNCHRLSDDIYRWNTLKVIKENVNAHVELVKRLEGGFELL
jgi:hypothetical protein